jgi:hypothetical protein
LGFFVRTRVMCQAGRAAATDVHGDIVAWLCERAPLWVMVHVCAMLRDYGHSRACDSAQQHQS